MRRFVTFFVFLAVLALVWEWMVGIGVWRAVLLPPPSRVLSFLGDGFADGSLLSATGVTMRRLFVGYVIGVVIGLPLGLLTARSRLARDSVGMLALGLQTLPSVCWVPMALLWFGQSEAAMLFVVVMGTIGGGLG